MDHNKSDLYWEIVEFIKNESTPKDRVVITEKLRSALEMTDDDHCSFGMLHVAPQKKLSRWKREILLDVDAKGKLVIQELPLWEQRRT
jgi:hypothetical protein